MQPQSKIGFIQQVFLLMLMLILLYIPLKLRFFLICLSCTGFLTSVDDSESLSCLSFTDILGWCLHVSEIFFPPHSSNFCVMFWLEVLWFRTLNRRMCLRTKRSGFTSWILPVTSYVMLGKSLHSSLSYLLVKCYFPHSCLYSFSHDTSG